MPTAPPRRCLRCRAMITGTRCATCHPPWEHPSESWQGVSRAGWPKARAIQLRAYPDCVMCGDQASEVDHVDGTDYATQLCDPAMMRSLCRACHHRRTVAQSVASRAARPSVRD